jgi:NADH-quinone oxidoreductase subunit L
LSGFFSKDEILWKTYASGTPLWCVAVRDRIPHRDYMFRLLYWFFGESRAAGARDSHSRDISHPKMARAISMTRPRRDGYALVVLAGRSVLAGYVGVPHVLGGGNRIERSSSRAFAHAGRGGQRPAWG